MKLTMWIFANHLQKYKPTASIKEDQFEIESVRLFSADVAPQKNTLYIGRLRDLFVHGDERIICAHNNNLLQLNTDDLESVLNDVLDILSMYTAWGNKMLSLLAGGAMLQDLFDASEDILKRPVFLLDSAQRHLAHTKKYGIGDVDEMWDYILEYGTCEMDFLIKFNRYDPNRISRKGIYSYQEKNQVLPNAGYHYNYQLDGNFLGSSTYIVLDHDETQGDIDSYQLFCEYLQRWFELHIQEQQNIILDTQIRAAITDESADTSELVRRFLLLGWKKDDRLLCYKLDAPFQPYSINTHLMQALNVGIKDIYAVTNDLSICVIANISRNKKETLHEQLKGWLLSSNYYATYGNEFTMEDSLYENYRFVEVTSLQVQKEIGMIYAGNEYMLSYLFSQMHKTIVQEIEHPALKVLREYDKKHHTEFYNTLYIYLKNLKNIANTANEMHLHRNTLLYRLDRLKELIGNDLSEYYVQLHILMSFEMEKNKLPAN
ncbi:MAG: helix-turn-helix domain-containing protein [Eubacterium sp.]|nr:helix-turn-helix domain-containing protein [Eubacterium sp.]